MKQLAIIILITTLHTSLGAQTECYHTLPPYKVANASAVAQYFTACQTGSAIQIRTYLAVYPFINDAILFSVYNAQGVLIGTTNYYGDVMIYNYDTPQTSCKAIQCTISQAHKASSKTVLPYLKTYMPQCWCTSITTHAQATVTAMVCWI